MAFLFLIFYRAKKNFLETVNFTIPSPLFKKVWFFAKMNFQTHHELNFNLWVTLLCVFLFCSDGKYAIAVTLINVLHISPGIHREFTKI